MSVRAGGDKDRDQNERRAVENQQKALLGLLLAIAGTFLCACIDYLQEEDKS